MNVRCQVSFVGLSFLVSPDDPTRPQTAHHRLLLPRLGNDDRVGWLVVMDDWLLRGGTLGGILGFAIWRHSPSSDRLRLRQAG